MQVLRGLKRPQILVHRAFSALHPNTDHHHLLHLIKNHNFRAAERVLHQLLDSGVEPHTIPPHPAFEFAALSALQWEGDPDCRLQQFTTWFRLVPDIHHHHRTSSSVASRDDDHNKLSMRHQRQPLKHTIDALFRSGKHNSDMTPLIKQFALICASKGYIHHVYVPVLEFLASQPISSTDLVDFISQIQTSAIQYERAHSSVPRARKLTRHLRIASVQLLCQSRRHQGVKRLLIHNAKDNETILPDEVYQYAIESLSQDDGVQGQRLIRRIKVLNKLREVETEKRVSREQVDVTFSDELGSVYPNPSSSALSNTLRACHRRLKAIESALLQNTYHVNPSIIHRVFNDILVSRSLLPSTPENEKRRLSWQYVAVRSEYTRLRAIALGRAYMRYSERWLSAEVLVLGYRRDWKEMFRFVSRYYVLTDLPAAYIDILSTPETRHACPRVESGVVDGEKIVLNPTSREAAVFLKWLVIQTATQSPSPKEDLTKLWNAFSSIPHKNPALDVLSAFVWSFAWIEQPYGAGFVLPKDGPVLSPHSDVSSTMDRLDSVWRDLSSGLGRSPTWNDFEMAVRREWEVDAVAESNMK